MRKLEKRSRHYAVTVVIRPQGFNKIYLEGIFIPKCGECPVQKIKTQCWEFIKSRIEFSKNGINPEQVEKEIKVRALPYDFVVCEDK